MEAIMEEKKPFAPQMAFMESWGIGLYGVRFGR